MADAGEEEVDDGDHRLRRSKPLRENEPTRNSLNSNHSEVTNMPFGNRKGPWGLGSKTGRAAGYCSGNPAPGYMNATARRFLRRGAPGRSRGFGFGSRFRWRAGPTEADGQSGPLTPTAQGEEPLDALKAQAGHLREALDDIQRRIGELETDGDDE